MDQNERERLTKAHQSAQQLLEEIRDLHAKTDNVALEELMLTSIEQVSRTNRLLKRLLEQR